MMKNIVRKVGIVGTVAALVTGTVVMGVQSADAGTRQTVKTFNSSERVCMDKNMKIAVEAIGDEVLAGGGHTTNAIKDREYVAYQLRALADNVQYNSQGRASLDRCWR